MKPNQTTGQQAEDAACNYLRRQGLTLLTRNYATRFGEIDLIMQQKSRLIFVEVRLRNHPHYVSGKESVDYFKQQRIIRVAHHYLQKQGNLYQQVCRFDMIDLQNRWGRFKVEWIQNAFELSE